MGKNIIVGQSGGPTAVINASLAGVYEAAEAAGYTVYGMRHGVQGLQRGEVFNLSEFLCAPQAVALLKTTPAAYLGSCRCRLPNAQVQPALYEKVFEILAQYQIGCFLYIGGNDSMDTIKKLGDYGAAIGSDIRFVGVPKTIDNDLTVTDHTPGYGSAAKYIATVTKELIRDSLVYDEKRVTLVEVMGRNAGWLTGAAALSKGEDCEGPDLLYLPETPFDPEDFLKRIQQLQQSRASVLVAVSEGIRLVDGHYLCEMGADCGDVDVFGHRQLSGAAQFLSAMIADRLGAKCRAVELSTMQRCAAHLASATDVQEAFAVGKAAVAAALEGRTRVMITLVRCSNAPYHCECECIDIHAIANLEKTVPPEWIDTENMSVTQEFLDYARPLIMGSTEVLWSDGLPRHLLPV